MYEQCDFKDQRKSNSNEKNSPLSYQGTVKVFAFATCRRAPFISCIELMPVWNSLDSGNNAVYNWNKWENVSN